MKKSVCEGVGRNGKRYFWRHYKNWADAKRAKTQLLKRADYIQTYLDTEGPTVYGTYKENDHGA